MVNLVDSDVLFKGYFPFNRQVPCFEKKKKRGKESQILQCVILLPNRKHYTLKEVYIAEDLV